MSLPVLFAAAATADIEAAVSWYESQSPGLGQAFMLQLDSAIAHIEHYPEGVQHMHKNLRRALLHRFPYAVVYRLTPMAIEVVGVLSTSRNPDIFATRSGQTS